jgi:hypothetical protein
MCRVRRINEHFYMFFFDVKVTLNKPRKNICLQKYMSHSLRSTFDILVGMPEDCSSLVCFVNKKISR